MSVIDDQIADVRAQADRLRREGQDRLLEADALDQLCDDLASLDTRILALSAP